MANKRIHERFLDSMDFMFFKHFKPGVDGWECKNGLETPERVAETPERVYSNLRLTLSWEMGAGVLSLKDDEIIPTFFKKYRQYRRDVLHGRLILTGYKKTMS